MGNPPVSTEVPAGDPGAEEVRPPPLQAFLSAAAIVSARFSGTRHHFMPLPGSLLRRATLSNDALRERLCRIEF